MVALYSEPAAAQVHSRPLVSFAPASLSLHVAGDRQGNARQASMSVGGQYTQYTRVSSTRAVHQQMLCAVKDITGSHQTLDSLATGAPAFMTALLLGNLAREAIGP